MIRSCKKAACLISESMEHRLPLHKRLLLRLHTGMCSMCSNYAADLVTLRRASQQMRQREDSDRSATDESLTEEARQRIKQLMSDSVD